MVMSSNIRTLLESVDQRIIALEQFAVKHRLDGQPLPPLPTPRHFRSPKGLYNAIDSVLMRIEHIADKLPRNVSYGRSHIQAKLIDYDAGEAFQRKVSDKLAKLFSASTAIGQLDAEFGADASIIAEQARLLQDSIKAEAVLITRASKMPKPVSVPALKAECEPLVDASSDVSDLKYDVTPKAKLHDHAMALGDCAAALGWVVSPTPLKHVREYRAIVETLTSNILANYIELGCNPVHSHFAESLNALMDVLVSYVEKEHPAGMRWNYAYGATPQGYRRAQRNVRKDSHPIGDFYCLMHSALTEFVLLSRELGSPLSDAANCVMAAYEEMAKAVENAAVRQRPHGDPSAVLKMLLISVQNELTALDQILQGVDEEDRFFVHCQALTEFVHSLQWSSATMQKMSPVGYIIDIERVTLLYLAKVDEVKDRSDVTYAARLHRMWAQAIRNMLTELKDYVKLHHPNELMFDTQRSRKSVDALVRRMSLSAQLSELKLKSTAKKWVPTQHTRKTKFGPKTVRTWRLKTGSGF